MEVAQIGVRTRAQALAMAKRKIGGDNQTELSITTVVQIKRRRRRRSTVEENSAQLATSQDLEERCLDHVLEASSSSSNCSTSEFEQQSLGIDLDPVHERETVEEVERSNFSSDVKDRKGTTNLSDPLDTSSLEMESPKPNSSPAKVPPASKIEEFFAAAEKEIQKKFTDKYNFDFGKDVPLDGRYEWVVIKP